MDKILNCLYNSENLVKFDKIISHAKTTKINNKNSHGFYYYINKK